MSNLFSGHDCDKNPCKLPLYVIKCSHCEDYFVGWYYLGGKSWIQFCGSPLGALVLPLVEAEFLAAMLIFRDDVEEGPYVTQLVERVES